MGLMSVKLAFDPRATLLTLNGESRAFATRSPTKNSNMSGGATARGAYQVFKLKLQIWISFTSFLALRASMEYRLKRLREYLQHLGFSCAISANQAQGIKCVASSLRVSKPDFETIQQTTT
jgi:hypothetical protein